MMQLIKNHWFKIAIVGLIAYGAMQKSFSFQFNMNSKTAPKEKAPEKYTEKENLQQGSSLSLFDLFSGGENALAKKFYAIDEAQKVEFVKRFGKVARDEQQRFGIPASVILATALVQSQVGTRALATEGNNYFALRLPKNSEDKAQKEGDFEYRTYASAWESFRDHSLFLEHNIALKKGNYKDWIAKIDEKFNTGEEYKQLLIEVIERYHLHELD